MSFRLDEIVPWGRSMEEYQLMFGLGAEELSGRILGCGDGPASFNAQMTALGHTVISCDPVYAFEGAQIRERFDHHLEPILQQVRERMDNYAWTYHRSVEELRARRIATMEHFLNDYEQGRQDGRYLIAALPQLPFRERTFDLALCSHLLFLYSKLLDLDFHVRAAIEMLRVAKEVRIFPVTSLDCELSPHLEGFIRALRERGIESELTKSGYQFQKNGETFLRLKR